MEFLSKQFFILGRLNAIATQREAEQLEKN